MTTLELARLVAQAALRATQPHGSAPYEDWPAVAVLKALRDSGHWFCVMAAEDSDEDDVPMPYQPGLFEVTK